MKEYLSSMTYAELSHYLVACHYTNDHDAVSRIMDEMEERFPEEYYDDLYGED